MIRRPPRSTLFPTRRSSDLEVVPQNGLAPNTQYHVTVSPKPPPTQAPTPQPTPELGITTPDRKSTRLNSSHLVISYAVFCLKKKKTNGTTSALPQQQQRCDK